MYTSYYLPFETLLGNRVAKIPKKLTRVIKTSRRISRFEQKHSAAPRFCPHCTRSRALVFSPSLPLAPSFAQYRASARARARKCRASAARPHSYTMRYCNQRTRGISHLHLSHKSPANAIHIPLSFSSPFHSSESEREKKGNGLARAPADKARQRDTHVDTFACAFICALCAERERKPSKHVYIIRRR